ncbi:unnamed protein product [Urochloa decumbens]|uniref:Uncharacterized protein n=1 Tax=Urochloa decumbens TaxID=240449 RepID=A0ABC9A3C4_9POAL
MEDPRRRSRGSAAAGRRLRCLLALAADYLKYLFMRRRRLMHRVARRTLALVHRHHGGGRKSSRHPWPARALMEREFSCADSPSPAFVAAKRLLLRSRLRGGGAAAAAAGAVSSCFGSFRAPWAAAVEEDHRFEAEDEEEDDYDEVLAEDGYWVQCGELADVDDRAEEFINMFYEQLRAQSFAAAVFQCSP